MRDTGATDRRLLRAVRKARQAETFYRLQVDNLQMRKDAPGVRERGRLVQRVCAAANAAAQAEVARFRLRALGRVTRPELAQIRRAFRDAGEAVPEEIHRIEQELD